MKPVLSGIPIYVGSPLTVFRKKEDPWNAIFGGFLTGGALAIRGGAKAMRNNAIGCAVLLAVIEGVGIAFGRMMAENTRLEAPLPPTQSTATI